MPVRGQLGPWLGFVASFRVAWNGVVETALHQRNMRIHVVAGLLVAILGSAVAFAVPERLALLLCVFLVLSAEVANSALEALVDLVTRERHDLARAAKDAGAGAVLVLAAASVAVLAVVIAHARTDVFAARVLRSRQLLAGVPLAAAMAFLLVPTRRPRAADAVLTAVGVVLLGVVASATVDLVFTAVAAVLCAVAIAAAFRRRRRGPRPAPSG